MIPIALIVVVLPVLTKFIRQVPPGVVLKNVTFPAAWPLPALNEHRWRSAVDNTDFDVCQTTTVSELTVSFGGNNPSYFLSSTRPCQQESGSQGEKTTAEKSVAESTNIPKKMLAGATVGNPLHYGQYDQLQFMLKMPETPSITTVLLPKSPGLFSSGSVPDKTAAREPLRMGNLPAQTPILVARTHLIASVATETMQPSSPNDQNASGLVAARQFYIPVPTTTDIYSGNPRFRRSTNSHDDLCRDGDHATIATK